MYVRVLLVSLCVFWMCVEYVCKWVWVLEFVVDKLMCRMDYQCMSVIGGYMCVECVWVCMWCVRVLVSVCVWVCWLLVSVWVCCGINGAARGEYVCWACVLARGWKRVSSVEEYVRVCTDVPTRGWGQVSLAWEWVCVGRPEWQCICVCACASCAAGSAGWAALPTWSRSGHTLTGTTPVPACDPAKTAPLKVGGGSGEAL